MLTKELGITVLGACAVYDIVAVSNFTFQDPATSSRKVRLILIELMCVCDIRHHFVNHKLTCITICNMPKIVIIEYLVGPFLA